jgi:hypothetical protein
MLLCRLQGKARRRSVDMVVKGVRSRATNSCENEHDFESCKYAGV